MHAEYDLVQFAGNISQGYRWRGNADMGHVQFNTVLYPDHRPHQQALLWPQCRLQYVDPIEYVACLHQKLLSS